jgi:hypothetical protein
MVICVQDMSDPDMPDLLPSGSRPIPLIGPVDYSQISGVRKILDYPVTDIPGLDISITLRALVFEFGSGHSLTL